MAARRAALVRLRMHGSDTETVHSAVAPWWHRLRWVQTSASDAIRAEQALLACGRQGAVPGAKITTFDTVLQGNDRTIHAIRCEIAERDDNTVPLVLVPGYGAGAAFFWRSLAPLAQGTGRCVYAVDWLGAGNSGRPRFTAQTHDSAVAFFLDALEAWRVANDIPRMALCGHSLGGYLATQYALKHPECVTHLVLVSPAGMTARSGPPPKSMLYRAIAAAWESGFTPHGLVRFLGPFAAGRTKEYASRRFHEGDALSPSEEEAFANYLLHTLSGNASAELALQHLLAPGAWAKYPLLEVLPTLHVPHLAFIYGATDWMDPRAGAAALEAIKQRQPHCDIKVADLSVLPRAGHYPFINAPDAFHEAMFAALRRDTS